MTRLALCALILAASMPPPAMAAPALKPEQNAAIGCVALLAIVASEQGRGAAEALAYVPLADRGGRYAQLVGEQVMADGHTQEAVRDAILVAVAGLQKDAAGAALPPAGRIDACIAMMDAAVPPPGLPQCAAAMALAYRDAHAREGLAGEAKDLATLAAVLDHKAREELRAAGKSEAEADVAMGLAAEAVAAAGADSVDLDGCARMAAP